MTDPTPDAELDELVAAYLDGEATAAERARVQGDPVLLARAEALRAVSRMVAEPVAAPDAALRDAQIAAALAASSTSPVVTAMPTNRSRSDLLRFASIAAAVLAILVAVPLLVSNTGSDDEDMATEASSADDGLAAMDSVAASEGDEDGAAEMAAEEEPSERSAGDEAAADDIAAAEAAPVAPEDGDAEEGFAGEEPAEEEAAFDDDLGQQDIDAILSGVARIDIDEAASPQALRRQVERRLGSESEEGDDDGAGEEAAVADLACGSAIASEISLRGPADAVGSTIVDGVVSEYVVFSGPDAIAVVFDATTCDATFAG
ncbi:MAG: hypothetical protein ACE367_16560 [Acidimicrobiales bacterium]